MEQILTAIMANLQPETLHAYRLEGVIYRVKATFKVGERYVILNVYQDNEITFELWSSLQQHEDDGVWFAAADHDVVETTQRFVDNLGKVNLW